MTFCEISGFHGNEDNVLTYHCMTSQHKATSWMISVDYILFLYISISCY